MIYFSDSDCLFKLAACDLLNEAQAAFSFSQSEVRITDEPLLTLQRRQGFFKKQLGAAGYKRAVAFVHGCTVIQTMPDVTEERILGNMLNLDGGEVDLICATKFAPKKEFFLVSGDKKWGRELCKHQAGSTIRERLERRCLHFEQILLKIIETNEWPKIRNKIVPALSCDEKTLGDKIFIESWDTTKADATARLRASISKLQSETGTLYLEF